MAHLVPGVFLGNKSNQHSRALVPTTPKKFFLLQPWEESGSIILLCWPWKQDHSLRWGLTMSSRLAFHSWIYLTLRPQSPKNCNYRFRPPNLANILTATQKVESLIVIAEVNRGLVANQCHGALEDIRIVAVSILTTSSLSSYRPSFDLCPETVSDSMMGRARFMLWWIAMLTAVCSSDREARWVHSSVKKLPEFRAWVSWSQGPGR